MKTTAETPTAFPSRQVRRQLERRAAKNKRSREKAEDRREAGRKLAQRQMNTPQTMRVVAMQAVSRLSASRFG